MSANYYRRKPLVVQALRLEWATWPQMCDFAGVGPSEDAPHSCWLDENDQPTDTPTERMGLLIPTLEGVMLAREGDWVVRGVKGELYPVKPDIFELIYEEVPPWG